MRSLLFAETPRAGRWNHRFLIPSHGEVDQSRLAKWASLARSHDQGNDYVAAIRRNVVQASGGREGDELLVLAGIEADTLSPEILDQLKNRLQCRMDDLENLVHCTIDWDVEGKSMLVVREELAEWFHQDLAPTLSAHRTAGRSSRRRAGFKGYVLAVVVLLGAVWWWWGFQTRDSGGNGGGSPVPKNGQERELTAVVPLLKTFAKDIGIDVDDRRGPTIRRGEYDPQAFSDLCARISKKLESDLFISISGQAESGSPAKQITKNEDTANPAMRDEDGPYEDQSSPPEHLLGQLKLLFQCLSPGRGVQVPETLEACLKDGGFRKRLLAVYSKHKRSPDNGSMGPIDYTGFLRHRVQPKGTADQKAQFTDLQQLCPGHSKEQVKDFRKLVALAKSTSNAAKNPEADLAGDGDVKRDLRTVANKAKGYDTDFTGTRADDPVAILGVADAKAAGAIKSWLSTAASQKLFDSDAETMEMKAVCRFVDKRKDLLEYVRRDADLPVSSAFADFLIQFCRIHSSNTKTRSSK